MRKADIYLMIIGIIALFLLAASIFAPRIENSAFTPEMKKISESPSAEKTALSSETPTDENEVPRSKPSQPESSAGNGFLPPLDRSSERVTKKPFGKFITPQDSPVQPEKFRGYHTGTDFEIFSEEMESDIFVQAICSGPIAAARTASGYGGVLVQNCVLDGNPVSVVYGHLRLASVSKTSGDQLAGGEKIGFLGKANSSDTDGERKHLHLGIYNGKALNILGYVPTKSQLSSWIDPCTIVCK